MLGDGAEVRGSSAGVSGETSLGALGGGASNRVVLGSLADDGVEQLDPTTKAVAAQIAVILLVVTRMFLSCSVQSAGSVQHRKDWSGIRGPKAGPIHEGNFSRRDELCESHSSAIANSVRDSQSSSLRK